VIYNYVAHNRNVKLRPALPLRQAMNGRSDSYARRCAKEANLGLSIAEGFASFFVLTWPTDF